MASGPPSIFVLETLILYEIQRGVRKEEQEGGKREKETEREREREREKLVITNNNYLATVCMCKYMYSTDLVLLQRLVSLLRQNMHFLH